ncbi:MAG: hypothetical protein FJ206_15940 [Gemmatimonadetes bacterium]|nr:hypothetical protein [Gemmatimonadota bacterium]
MTARQSILRPRAERLQTTNLATHHAPLEGLFALRSDRPDIVSCYVRIDPESRNRQGYLIDIKRRARDLNDHLQARGDPVAPAVAADLARILDWLGSVDRLPPTPGVALFASERLGVFAVVPLPRVHRNRVGAATTPLLHGVIDAREALDNYLAVVVDRLHARIFEVDATGANELSGLVPYGRRGGRFHGDRQDAPGWGERDYHQRLETEIHRHYARIVEAVTRVCRTRPIAGIALLGPDEHCRGLTSFFPRALRGSLLGTARLNPKSATGAQVAEAAWTLRDQREHRDETELIAQLEDGTPQGWAVNGAREVLRALAHGQVRSLLVPDGQHGGGFRCRDSGRLVLSKGDCAGEGDPDAIMELVDAAIEEALHQRGDVVIIDDPVLAKRIDGLGALLRFREQ